MTGQLKEVFGIYTNDRRQQGEGKHFIVVMTEADNAAMHEAAKRDIEKIAQAAGVEMRKTASVAVRRCMRRQQEAGIEQINGMLQKTKGSENVIEALKWAATAAGYANGMYCGGLMSRKELHDVIEVIDQTFTKTETRIKDSRQPFWLRIIGKWVQA